MFVLALVVAKKSSRGSYLYGKRCGRFGQRRKVVLIAETYGFCAISLSIYKGGFARRPVARAVVVTSA
jgi:hypothetical protein